jgi:hypothetical protein
MGEAAVGEESVTRPLPSALATGNPGLARIVACAADRRLFHDDVSGVFQMPDDSIAGDLRHEPVAIVNSLFSAKYQGERDRIGEIARIGGRERVIHGLEGYKGARTFQEQNGSRHDRPSTNFTKMTLRLAGHPARRVA